MYWAGLQSDGCRYQMGGVSAACVCGIGFWKYGCKVREGFGYMKHIATNLRKGWISLSACVSMTLVNLGG